MEDPILNINDTTAADADSVDIQIHVQDNEPNHNHDEPTNPAIAPQPQTSSPHTTNNINVNVNVNANDRLRNMPVPPPPTNGSETRAMSHLYVLFSIAIAMLAIISPPGRIDHHNHHHHNHNHKQAPPNHSPSSSESTSTSAKYTVLHGDLHSSMRKLLDEDHDQYFHEKIAAAMTGQFNTVEQVAKAAAAANLFKFKDTSNSYGHGHASSEDKGNGNSNTNHWLKFFGFQREEPPTTKHKKAKMVQESGHAPLWLRWMDAIHLKHHEWSQQREREHHSHKKKVPGVGERLMKRFIDPSLLQWANLLRTGNSGTGTSHLTRSKSALATEVIDKVLTSTPRIVTIINLLLAVTYLLHSIVATLFLGEASTRANYHTETEFATGDGPADATGGGGGVGASTSDRMQRSGRERLGGYLLFKLLLITAVVEPDTLDLLILLSWYTLLAFLKSLAYLAGMTTAHTAASGQPPHRGVWKLLVVVLICDISAATTCAALFHTAGVGMVALLISDCVLLALDIMTHLARFSQQILDQVHQEHISLLELRQVEMHEDFRRERSAGVDEDDNDKGDEDDNAHGHDHDVSSSQGDDDHREDNVHFQSRQIDHEMEAKETTHANRLSFLDNVAFAFELFALIVTMAHFLHVWALHGVTLNLVDGVLALHLHSAVSAFGKKIAERKNLLRIARDLDKCFEDATEIELAKASAAGDVCCICLGTMAMGNVKKMKCGHLYHTKCLREVVERARSIEAARCPLCRASLLDGKQVQSHEDNGRPQGIFFANVGNIAPTIQTGERNNPNEEARNQQNNNDNQPPDPIPAGETTGVPLPGNQQAQERALFRLSTERFIPHWMPIPAVSFEVVRRFPNGGAEDEAVPPSPHENQNENGNGNATQNASDNLDNTEQTQARDQNRNEAQETLDQPLNDHDQQDIDGQGTPSFWRRFLVLAGAIPMSPEEEALALGQLVDMFPQYDRSALLRELRDRGSAEGVAESILSGNFIGVNRNAATTQFDEFAPENLH